MKNLNIAMIGHRFMGKAHSNAYHNVNKFFDLKAIPVKKIICGRSNDVIAFAEKWGWENYCHNYNDAVKRDDVDIVDICTPNSSHAEIAIAAANAKKAILCEKPLAMNVTEAEKMVAAAEENNVPTMVCFNYRRVPAIALLKKMIDEGKLGRVYHFRAQYLQDWIMNPKFPRVWRLVKALAGSGVHGDLNAHIIDLARFLVGEISNVSGLSETFIKERPLENFVTDSNETGAVDVDDATLFLARFKNGAIGTFEATRFGGGNKNGLQFEINGSKGSFKFNLENMNELFYLNLEENEQGFKKILVTEPNHPYVGNYWPPGHIIGYEHTFVNLIADFINGVAEGTPLMPDFKDALKTQKVLDAVIKSAKKRCWMKIY